MPRISEYYFRSAILFLIVGISIGIHMSISQNHNVIGAHAHINLLGWVTSALFGGYYALNPAKAAGRLPMIQYAVFTLGVIVMGVSLYLLLAGNTAVEPIVAASSLITFAGVLLFAWIVWMPSAAGSRMAPRAAQ
jgi:NADH:ubiquinone oxidoreductase subunit 3 (subunit A)